MQKKEMQTSIKDFSNALEQGHAAVYRRNFDSVCSPSRAAILTGRTPYRNGVCRWLPPGHFAHLPASEITLPQLLRSNGYQTAHF